MLQQSLELLHRAGNPQWLLMDPKAQLWLSWHIECQPHFTWQPVPAQCQNSVHQPRAACACSPCPFQCPVHRSQMLKSNKMLQNPSQEVAGIPGRSLFAPGMLQDRDRAGVSPLNPPSIPLLQDHFQLEFQDHSTGNAQCRTGAESLELHLKHPIVLYM